MANKEFEERIAEVAKEFGLKVIAKKEEKHV